MSDRFSSFPGTRFLTQPVPQGFGIRFRVRDDNSVYATVVFDESKEGGPGLLHGGAIATVLDEAMGVAAYENHSAGYTVTLTCNYKKKIPLGEEITIRARVDTIEDRRVFASCEACLPNGDIAVDATGIFVISSELQQLLDSRRSKD